MLKLKMYLPKLLPGLLCIGLLLSGCGDKPKVISSKVTDDQDTNGGSDYGIFNNQPENMSPGSSVSSDVHTIKVNEVLSSDKYVYLNVNEGNSQYWIVTRKRDVEIGETYFFSGGLLKTNYENKEINRVFDKIYLVSNIVSANHGNNPATINDHEMQGFADPKEPRIFEKEGSIKIADLLANPKKYEGKKIQLTGKCVKLNANIMGRNWIHLQDGSKNDYDLVLTSKIAIPVGHIVTMTGTVSLNKDFGAGYQYDIIIENCDILK